MKKQWEEMRKIQEEDIDDLIQQTRLGCLTKVAIAAIIWLAVFYMYDWGLPKDTAGWIFFAVAVILTLMTVFL